MKTFLLLSVFVFFIKFAFSQSEFTTYTLPSGYSQDQILFRNALSIDASNNIWIGFKRIGLAKFDGTNWTVYNVNNSTFPDSVVYCIGFINNNVIAGTNKGLIIGDGTNWTTYNSANSGFITDTIKVLAQHGTDIWLGTNNGAIKYDGINWTNFTTQNSGIAGDTVTSFDFEANGTVWFGTTEGLSSLHQNTWTTYDNSNSGLTDNRVSSIVFDSNHDLWMATYNSNLFKMSSGLIKNFKTEIYTGAIPLNYINYRRLILDPSGAMVSIGGNGLQRFTGTTVEIIYYAHFYNSLNILGSVYSQYGDYDSNGKLWFVSGLPIVGPVYMNFYCFDSSYYTNYGYGLTNDNFKNLDVNDVKAAIMNNGSMHWNLANSQYEVPKGSGKKPVYASALWIGGIDNTGNLRVSAQTYRQTGDDFWPGPIDTLTGIADSASVIPYDKIWKVNRFDVEDFKYNFQNGNVANGTYTIPQDILTWPVHGTGNISRYLAPFIDFNADNHYNPYDGDYPQIKGDQMLYWILNDNLRQQTASGGIPLGFEIHASAYAYTCAGNADSNSVLNTTTLYNYRIINRSNIDYDSLFIGLWCDVDLGNATDDYIGCDTLLNAGFVYNGDNDDEGFSGYSLNPPMLNVQILNGPVAIPGDGLNNDNDLLTDEPGERCLLNHFMYTCGSLFCEEPYSDLDFYRYEQSIWHDWTHLSFGGYGHNLGSTDFTNFIYNGTPYSITEWAETNTNNTPSDRNLNESSGPFSLAAGAETSIDFAYVWTRDTAGPNGLNTSIARNRADLQRIKSWFDHDNFPSCLSLNINVEEVNSNNSSIKVYPNPVGDKLFFEIPLKNITVSYEITDLFGRKLATGITGNNFVVVKNLSNGVYILQLSSTHAKFRQKFLKY